MSSLGPCLCALRRLPRRRPPLLPCASTTVVVALAGLRGKVQAASKEAGSRDRDLEPFLAQVPKTGAREVKRALHVGAAAGIRTFTQQHGLLREARGAACVADLLNEDDRETSFLELISDPHQHSLLCAGAGRQAHTAEPAEVRVSRVRVRARPAPAHGLVEATGAAWAHPKLRLGCKGVPAARAFLYVGVTRRRQRLYGQRAPVVARLVSSTALHRARYVRVLRPLIDFGRAPGE